MAERSHKFKSVDEYIDTFSKSTKLKLEELRSTIKKAAPKSEEVISYNMPAFRQNGILVYFAGYAHHIGFYPTGSGIKAFVDEIGSYQTSKGTIRFPLDEPLPLKLVAKIVKFRIAENEARVKLKSKSKK